MRTSKPARSGRLRCAEREAILVLLAVAVTATIGAPLGQSQTRMSAPVNPSSFTGDLSTLPKSTGGHPAPPQRALNPNSHPRPPLPPGPPDPVWQKHLGAAPTIGLAPGVTPPQFTTPSPNFDTFDGGDGPPDANGAVGPNHYITMVNFTFQIFDKKGNLKAGPTDPATLWSSAPAGDA